MVKKDDLSDWGLEALSIESIHYLSGIAYTDDIIRTPARKTLAAVALELQTD